MRTSPIKLLEPIAALGRGTGRVIEEIGRWGLVSGRTLAVFWRPPFRPRNYIKQVYGIGVGSVVIIIITAFFTGAVFALQANIALRMVNAEALVGAMVQMSLTRELGPVLTALLVVGRSGSAMAAEIGTMRVTEQVDALEVMSVDPVHYLVVPRLFASLTAIPLLNVLFNFVAMIGAYGAGVYLLMISPATFMDYADWYVDPPDFYGGMWKSLIFGAIMATVSCTKGLYTRGGAEGVGRATTAAVVISSVAILVSDFFLTKAIEY